MLFREDLTVVDAGWRRVPLEAGFDPGEEALPGMHQRVYFESPVVPQESGYIYVWVSNESEDTEVWFDDLKVTHTGTFVAQATDYGAWGDVLREQRTDERKYRFGYQGQFAEKDDETGWNHFELRQYDAVVGRWTTTDPAGQYWSPYVGMGNDPVNSSDPDGAYSWVGAWWRNGFSTKGLVNAGEGWGWGYTTSGIDEDGTPWVSGVFSDPVEPFSIDFSQNEVFNRMHERQWMTDPLYRAKFGGDAIQPDYTIESFVVGGALFKGVSWAGQRLLYGTSNRVFWSGGLGSAGEAAGSYAAANGAITLEMTFTGKALTGLTNMTSYSTTKPLWNLASRGFANGARGSAEVFINPVNITSKSIWLTTERGILRANGIPYNYNIIPH